MKDLFKAPKKFKEQELNKSAGILDDFAVRKIINTREGTIEKVPVNNNDIVNKAYADSLGGGGLSVVTEDPATSTNGTLILNTTDYKVKIWFDSRWQTLHTLTIQVKILMETGEFLLLETGDKFLTE